MPELPSLIDASAIDRVGVAFASSFVIVPVPWLSAMVAPTALLRWTVNVSSGSKAVSPLIVTVKALVVAPAAMRRPGVLLTR